MQPDSVPDQKTYMPHPLLPSDRCQILPAPKAVLLPKAPTHWQMLCTFHPGSMNQIHTVHQTKPPTQNHLHGSRIPQLSFQPDNCSLQTAGNLPESLLLPYLQKAAHPPVPVLHCCTAIFAGGLHRPHHSATRKIHPSQ